MLQALLREVLKFVRFQRQTGIDFSKKSELTFDEIPGLAEAGWTAQRYESEKKSDERSFEDQCGEVLEVLFSHENSWPFRKPVDKDKVRDYYDVIKKPMDLETVKEKVNVGLAVSGEKRPAALAATENEEMKDNVSGEGKPNMESYTCMDDFRADIK